MITIPGTWINQPYDHWDELDTLFTITDEYGKKAAVIETGFSTYKIVIPLPPPLPPIVIVNHTEEMQKEFINTAFPAIRGKAQANERNLTFVTWYELVDEDNPSVPIEAEKHFGIIRSNFTKKLGYND